jgi:putative FmdB family regulatory protein
MPLYEYECEKCGHRFEKIQKFSDKMVKKCPECGGKVEQMISAPAVQFKGSGWYVTDYANKSRTPSGEGGGKDSKKEEKSKSEGSSKESSSKESSSKESASKEGSSKDSSSKQSSTQESSAKESSSREGSSRESSSRKPDKRK